MLANESIKASIFEWKGLGIGLLKHDVQAFGPICGDCQHPGIDITACHGHALIGCETSHDSRAACQIQKSVARFQVGTAKEIACPWNEDNWHEEFFISLGHITAQLPLSVDHLHCLLAVRSA